MNATLHGMVGDYRQVFGQLADCSEHGVVITDGDKVIRYANRSAIRETGYGRRELVGRGIALLFRRQDRKRYISRIFAGLRKTTQWSGDLELANKRGEVMRAFVLARSIPAGRKWDAATLFVFRHPARRGRELPALAATGSRLGVVLDAMEDALYLCDAEGSILLCNEACGRMTGYSRAEMIGMSLPYPWLDPPDAKKISRSLRYVLKDGTLKNCVVGFRRRSASPIIVSLALARLDESPGAPPLVVTSGRDITDVEFANELKRTTEQVHRLVEDVKVKSGQLRTLCETNRLVLRNAELGRTFKLITAGVMKLVEHDLAGIYLLDAEHQLLRPHTLSKQTRFSRQVAKLPIAVGEGLVGATAISGKLIWVNDAQLDPRSRYPAGMKPEKEHLIAVPLRGRKATFGVLVVSRNRDPRFIEEEALIVQSFADAAIVALENGRLHDELRTLQSSQSSGAAGGEPPVP